MEKIEIEPLLIKELNWETDYFPEINFNPFTGTFDIRGLCFGTICYEKSIFD